MRPFALLPLLCAIAAAIAVEGPPGGAIVSIKEAVVAPPPNDAIVDTAAVYATATTVPQGYGSVVESYASTPIPTTSAYTEAIPSEAIPSEAIPSEAIPSEAEKETETSVPATVYMTVSVPVSVAYTTTLTASAEPTYSAREILSPTWHHAGPSSYHNSTVYSNTTSTLSHSRMHTKSATKSMSAKPTTFSTRMHTYSSNGYQNATVTLSTPTYSAPTESAATATATATFYPGGLTDPTLDKPCYNASCANPSSDMNFKVTITPGEVGTSSGAQAVRVGAMSALVGVVALMFVGGL